MHNTLYLSTLVASLVFFGCGIKNTIALAPARVSEDDTEQWVRIEHNTANYIQSFKGYNIYYKLYIEGNTSTVNSDRDYLTSATRTPSESALTTKKFRLLQRFKNRSTDSVNTQTPHIKPDNSNKVRKSHTTYIDFSASQTIYNPLRNSGDEKIPDDVYLSPDGLYYNMLFIRYDNDEVKNVENVKRDTDSPKSFFESKDGSSQYSASDSDIKNMIGSNFNRNDNTKLLIVFAVIPYGIDFTAGKISYGPIAVTDSLELDYQNTP